MLKAFSTAATGMSAQQMIVDTIANNLANINTTGFKRSQVNFQDLMYVKSQAAGANTAATTIAPSGFEIGSGVSPGSTVRVYTPGELQNTGRDLDVAIQGDGFLQVTIPGSGIQYTRDGALQVNDKGQLCTSQGYLIEPQVTIPAEARSLSIGKDGSVTVYTGSNTTPQSLTQITLARFANPAGLSSEGGNLFSQTPASGTPTVGVAGQNGMGTLQQSFLEKSNVQMVTELVNLITAQRAYETNSRAIKAGDEMLTTANQLTT